MPSHHARSQVPRACVCGHALTPATRSACRVRGYFLPHAGRGPAPCSTCLHEGSCCCLAWLVINAASLQPPPPTMGLPRTAPGRFDDSDGRVACPVHVSWQCRVWLTIRLAVSWRRVVHVRWCVGANSHHTWYQKENNHGACTRNRSFYVIAPRFLPPLWVCLCRGSLIYFWLPVQPRCRCCGAVFTAGVGWWCRVCSAAAAVCDGCWHMIVVCCV